MWPQMIIEACNIVIHNYIKYCQNGQKSGCADTVFCRHYISQKCIRCYGFSEQQTQKLSTKVKQLLSSNKMLQQPNFKSNLKVICIQGKFILG